MTASGASSRISRFSRFSKETLPFIEKASKQNHPEWLNRNREAYENLLLAPLQHLAQHLKKELSSEAPGYHFPQKGIGRLKRPAHRIGKNGGMYKNWISYSAARPAKSRFEHNPNLFFMMQTDDPDGDDVLVAGGLYMPSSQQTRAIREAIAAEDSSFASDLTRLFASKAFSARFKGGFSSERISTRVPRGFDPNHPKINWLKLQAFFVWKPYSKKDFTSTDFSNQVALDWAQILRLNELLDLAIQRRLPTQAAQQGKPPTHSARPRRGKADPKTQKQKPGSLSSLLEQIEAPIRKMDF